MSRHPGYAANRRAIFLPDSNPCALASHRARRVRPADRGYFVGKCQAGPGENGGEWTRQWSCSIGWARCAWWGEDSLRPVDLFESATEASAFPQVREDDCTVYSTSSRVHCGYAQGLAKAEAILPGLKWDVGLLCARTAVGGGGGEVQGESALSAKAGYTPVCLGVSLSSLAWGPGTRVNQEATRLMSLPGPLRRPTNPHSPFPSPAAWATIFPTFRLRCYRDFPSLRHPRPVPPPLPPKTLSGSPQALRVLGRPVLPLTQTSMLISTTRGVPPNIQSKKVPPGSTFI